MIVACSWTAAAFTSIGTGNTVGDTAPGNLLVFRFANGKQ
jgi:hypothetical protein